MGMKRGTTLVGLIMILGIFVAHRSHRVIDEVRYQQGAWDTGRMRPNGRAMRTAVMGYHTLFADLLWVRTVLVAAELYEDPSPDRVTWLRESLLAMAELDPRWRTLYFYGGGFLSVVEDIEGSNQVFELGMEHLPEDPYFPFSRGMNAYLNPDPEDPEGSRAEAAHYLSIAAELPGAPGWYMGSVAVYLSEASQRDRALLYLEEQIEHETRPRALEVLTTRWANLKHDELAEEMEQYRQQYEAARGRPLEDPNQLGQLPDDPLGAAWIIAPDGAIRSAARDAYLENQARLRERGFLMREASRAWLANHE